MNQDSKTTHGHEVADVPIRPIFITGLAFAGIAVVIFIGVALLFNYLYGEPVATARPTFADTGALPPEPRLQVAPAADLQQFRAREDESLQTYGWVDREKGVVRVPIDRAMELLIERRKPE